MQKHTIMGGKVHLYKRDNSSLWQCSTYLKGRNHRVSTKETSFSKAKDIAEDWYLELRGKASRGELKHENTFEKAAKRFKTEYQVMVAGERNARYVKDHSSRLKNHLIPFFGKMGLSEINPGTVQDYRLHRMNGGDGWKPPSRSTMHHEIVTLRHVLKTAVRHRWLEYVPDISMPYRASKKVSHRAWFSPEEYKQLYTATRDNIQKAQNSYLKNLASQLHDKVLFMANTGLRPDEANNLQYRDVSIIDDEGTSETILEIEVRGKRGVGYCKSTAGAVLPFQRLVERNKPAPTDLVFPHDHKKQFNRILHQEDLKFDRDGNRRTAYSLRHTYICLRLLEGADIYQIAKNCRTSVEMIEKHYAVHLKDQIDASAINVRKVKR